jgi:hypothetical protein
VLRIATTPKWNNPTPSSAGNIVGPVKLATSLPLSYT